MEFGGDNGCSQRISDPDSHSYGHGYTHRDGDGYPNGYRHRHSCTHTDTFIDPESNGNGYRHSHNCAHTFSVINSNFYANACDWSGSRLQF